MKEKMGLTEGADGLRLQIQQTQICVTLKHKVGESLLSVLMHLGDRWLL